jgi:hypothetical protein
MKRQPLTFTLPLCAICRFKHPDNPNYRKGFPTCAPFPNLIPEAVRENPIDHRRALSGDNGIRFELSADTAPLRQVLSSLDDLFRKQDLKTEPAK